MPRASSLAETMVAFFKEKGVRLEFRKGDIIHSTDMEQNIVYMVDTGYVKTYSINANGSLNVHVISNNRLPDIFPLTGVINAVVREVLYNPRETMYYEAMTDAVIYKVKLPDFAGFVKKHIMTHKLLLERLATEYNIFLDRAENLSLRHAYDRVVHRLVTYSRRFGKESDSGIVIEVPLTHQDIANALSMARETVSRELEKLKKSGLIAIEDQHIIIKNLDKLRQQIEE